MIDLIEQSTLFRLIAIVTVLFSFLQIAAGLLRGGTLGLDLWPFASELPQVLVAALLGGFLFPIIIVLVPGRVGALLYDIFSFGNPSFLVIIGLLVGALFGVIYRPVVDWAANTVMLAITMAIGMGFLAFLAGGVVAAIGSGGSWEAILNQALSWGKIGAIIGAGLGLAMGFAAADM